MTMVTVIDCANDEEIATNLKEYLSTRGYEAIKDDSLVIITDGKDIKKNLESFIKDTDKIGYKILQSDSETFILAKVVHIENFGLPICEICGYAAPEEELFAHRRAHGIGFLV